jgi:hypothetical protein
VMSSCQKRLECCARIGIRRHDLEPRRWKKTMTTVFTKRSALHRNLIIIFAVQDCSPRFTWMHPHFR